MRIVHANLSVLLGLLLTPAVALAQESLDERLERAAALFEAGDFVAAATLSEELERETGDSYMALNTMVAWYEARRCPEALAAYDRVDKNLALQPTDLVDLDRVKSYCTLEQAQALMTAGDFAAAAALVDGLAPQDPKLRQRRDAMRDEIARQRQAAAQPAPAPAPAARRPSRDRRALYAGYGFLAAGGALGAATIVKHVGFDLPALRRGRDQFAVAYRCPDGTWKSCDSDQQDLIRQDAGYQSWDATDLTRAETAKLAMGLSAGVLLLTGGGLLVYHFLSARGGEVNVAVTPLVGADAHGASLAIEF